MSPSHAAWDQSWGAGCRPLGPKRRAGQAVRPCLYSLCPNASDWDNKARVINDGMRSVAQTTGSYRLRSVALLLAGVAGAALLAIDQPRHIAHAGSQTNKLQDPQFVAEGAKLFAPSCGNAYCHGTGGVGGGAPRLRGRGLEAAYLLKTISNGIPGGTDMEARGFCDVRREGNSGR